MFFGHLSEKGHLFDCAIFDKCPKNRS